MKQIQLLDCTLRDGARIIDCALSNFVIHKLVRGLTKARIDIIELGFLRESGPYHGNSTFFTHVDQMRPFIPQSDERPLFVAFVDYGMFSPESIPPHSEGAIDGFRFGFTKKDVANIYPLMLEIQDKGYKLFVQSVETLSYSDKELLDVIEMVNRLKPYSFGIVDTYGAMYEEDLYRYYELVENNLDKSIAIDFHSHNNYQLSFSLAQKLVKIAREDRKIIIDATLNGMGKCAGNLNTELIADYLIRKRFAPYDLDVILDLCDEYIAPINANSPWGYSIPAFFAGLYRSHPNNIIYFTEKLRMGTKTIKNILSMMDDDVRKVYDYDNIERLYVEYIATEIDDSEAQESLAERLSGRHILIKSPGRTLSTHKDLIENYIMQHDPVVFSVNFVDDECPESIPFFGNQYRYDECQLQRAGRQCLITSRTISDYEQDIVVNYYGVIKRGWEHFDNSVIMLLRLCLKLGCRRIALAGFDGFYEDEENYIDGTFNNLRNRVFSEKVNDDIASMLSDMVSYMDNVDQIKFLTPSLYETYVE